jgi:hypothetical protein
MPTAGPVNRAGAIDAAATLAAWRERGAHRRDPVRFRLIEAMARRTAGHRGEARRLLDARLAVLIDAYGRVLDEAPAPAVDAAPSARSGLAELLDHIARHAPAPEVAAPGAIPLSASASGPELKGVRFFNRTWTRLRAERRITQSLARVPENAGPLNSHQLVHRALVLMHELSPDYLNRFMAHVDGLLWLEQLQGRAALPAVSSAKAEAQPPPKPRKRPKS